MPTTKTLVGTNSDIIHFTTLEGFEKVPPKFSIDFRNRYMLKHADFVVAYVAHDFGTGAAKYVALAKRKNIPIVNIADLLQCVSGNTQTKPDFNLLKSGFY